MRTWRNHDSSWSIEKGDKYSNTEKGQVLTTRNIHTKQVFYNLGFIGLFFFFNFGEVDFKCAKDNLKVYEVEVYVQPSSMMTVVPADFNLMLP